MSALGQTRTKSDGRLTSAFLLIATRQADSRPRSLRYGVGQKLKGGSCKGLHVGEPLGAAGLKRNSPLDGACNRKTSVAGRITVAIANRSGRAGFTQAPSCREACLRAARKQQRVRLGRRPKLRECGFV